MLNRRNRLPRLLFKRISSKGVTISSPIFNFKYAVSVSAELSKRFAVVVAKKVSKKAVIRNRLRRQVYSTLGGVLEKIRPDSSGIFYVKSLPKNFQVIKLEVNNLLIKAKLL